VAVGLGWNQIAGIARPVRAFLQGILGRWVEPKLPKDANVPLVERWEESFMRGVHSLVVVAADGGTDHYVTRILESMPARTPGVVSCVRVPGTNHLFTSGAGRDAVLSALERWVMETFGGSAEPRVRREGGA